MKYLEQYKQIHKKKRYGISGDRLVDKLYPVINKECTSLLDYGCGQSNTATLLAPLLGITDVAQYDPAVVGRDTKPTRDFHTVTCTDVLEHIPEDELDDMLIDVWGYCEEAIFVVALRLAGEVLPNGDNAHCTVHPKEWWEKKLKGTWAHVKEIKSLSIPYCVTGFKVSSNQIDP